MLRSVSTETTIMVSVRQVDWFSRLSEPKRMMFRKRSEKFGWGRLTRTGRSVGRGASETAPGPAPGGHADHTNREPRGRWDRVRLREFLRSSGGPRRALERGRRGIGGLRVDGIRTPLHWAADIAGLHGSHRTVSGWNHRSQLLGALHPGTSADCRNSDRRLLDDGRVEGCRHGQAPRGEALGLEDDQGGLDGGRVAADDGLGG